MQNVKAMEADDSFEEAISNLNEDEFNDISKANFDLNTDLPLEERFPSFNEEEVDDLAQLKHERNTKNQTKWAIKIIRGKLL